jgi:hypothetical protein
MNSELPNQWRLILTREERLTLLKHVALPAELRQRLAASTSSRPAEVWLSISEANSLRDEVAEVLQVKGFGPSYETTPIGQVLEGLIDKLYTG